MNICTFSGGSSIARERGTVNACYTLILLCITVHVPDRGRGDRRLRGAMDREGIERKLRREKIKNESKIDHILKKIRKDVQKEKMTKEESALNLLNGKSDQLPDTLAEFMDFPRDLPKEVFLKKYGAEKIFWLIGRDEETGDWTLHWRPKFKGTGSEGVYFTYEAACAALVIRSVTCPFGQYVIRCGTVQQLFTIVPWNVRFIRSDGKVLTIWRNGDMLSATVYTQDELMARFVSKYGGKTVIAEDFFPVNQMDEFNTEDLVVWALAEPDIQKNIGKWNLRTTYKYDRAGLYFGERCYHVFSTYEEAAKEIQPGSYPQKTCLHQELLKYDRPHVLYCDGTEILFVPKEMAKAKSVVEDVKNNTEYARMEDDMTSYLKETDMSENRIAQTVEKLKKYKDIFEAFHSYIMSTEYPQTPVVEGYSPKSLHEKVGSKLSPVGIMNFLIYLREDPQEALKDLDAGLPVK